MSERLTKNGNGESISNFYNYITSEGSAVEPAYDKEDRANEVNFIEFCIVVKHCVVIEGVSL